MTQLRNDLAEALWAARRTKTFAEADRRAAEAVETNPALARAWLFTLVGRQLTLMKLPAFSFDMDWSDKKLWCDAWRDILNTRLDELQRLGQQGELCGSIRETLVLLDAIEREIL